MDKSFVWIEILEEHDCKSQYYKNLYSVADDALNHMSKINSIFARQVRAWSIMHNYMETGDETGHKHLKGDLIMFLFCTRRDISKNISQILMMEVFYHLVL